jgi:hypothetical protein
MSEHPPPQAAHWPEGAVFTLGHSTLPIERFIALLQTYGIKRLVDIRTTANAVRLQLHALAYNLANFMRTLALPEAVKQWSLTSLREKLVKIGAKVVRHGRYVIFQMAEVAVPRTLFAEILRMDRSISKAQQDRSYRP